MTGYVIALAIYLVVGLVVWSCLAMSKRGEGDEE